MQPNSLINTVQTKGTSFLWNQWGSLGVTGTKTSRADRVVDPEALLLLTWSVGRSNPRIFDAAYNWCRERERDLDFNRIKTSLRKADLETRSVATAWAKSLVSEDARKWSSIAKLSPRLENEASLFLDDRGNPLPQVGPRDAIFSECGWIRGRIDRQHSLRTPRYQEPEQTRMLLRKLIGVGVRSELLAFASFNEAATTRELAKSAGYSQRSIQSAISDLQSIGFADWARTRGVTEPIRFTTRPLRYFLKSLGNNSSDKTKQTKTAKWQNMLEVAVSFPRVWNLARQSDHIDGEAGRRQTYWEMATLLGQSIDSTQKSSNTRRSAYSHLTVRELEDQVLHMINTIFGD